MKLDQVTLVTISSIKLPETIKALTTSMQDIEYAQVLLISHERPVDLPESISFKKCRRLNSIDAYNWFMVFELSKYITTPFALVVQHDGYVLDASKWHNEFLNYDYIGAPWPQQTFFDQSGKEVRVGNGGFSLRSKKLLDVFHHLNLEFDDDLTSFPSEDWVICVKHRQALEASGLSFAPVKLASIFSRELVCEDSEQATFGFHFHPTSTIASRPSVKIRIGQAIKKCLKIFLPRFLVNRLKLLFLENIRQGLDQESE